MAEKQIRVTVEDLLTGEKEVAEVGDDYLLICAGSCYLDGTQVYPTKGHARADGEGSEGGLRCRSENRN